MEENRKLKQFLAIAGVITLINGVSYTLVPGALLPNYAVVPTSGAVLGFRLFGAALLTFGLILWLLRDFARMDRAARPVDRRFGG